MMHGMTGTAEMMQPFAEKILPEGWTLLVPDARFNHPRRGKTWWRYEDEDPDVTRRLQLSRRELMDVDSSLSQLEKLIAEEAPLGPLVVGGFSQGGAMAQEMLQLPLADRIIGIVALGTRLVRPMVCSCYVGWLTIVVEPKSLFTSIKLFIYIFVPLFFLFFWICFPVKYSFYFIKYIGLF